jgi:hypothetical protein
MRLARLNPGFVTLDATQSISKATHDGKTLLFNVAAGHTITLPAAVGTGCKLRFVTKTAATSGSNIVKVQNATDVIKGNLAISIAAGGALSAFQAEPTVAGADTVTMNRTTTGGAVAGDWLEFEDIAAGVWVVKGVLQGTAAPATPFTATVS